MNLPDFIKEIGVLEFSERFGITKRSAEAYRFKQRRPRFPLAVRIVNETPVTWEGIYGDQKKAS